MRRVKTTIGIIKDGDCIGVVRRSGRVRELGHFCYVQVPVNGRQVWAGGAEDRIYPFHSVEWKEIGERQPDDMIPAIGFCNDGNGYAFYHRGTFQTVARGQTFEPIPKEKWQPGWSLCGLPNAYCRIRGYLIEDSDLAQRAKFPRPVEARELANYLDELQAAIRRIEGARPHGTPLVVTSGQLPSAPDEGRVSVRRFISKPVAFDCRGTELEALARYIVATLSDQVDWMKAAGTCPVCEEPTKIQVPSTSDGRPIGECGHAFPIYDWIRVNRPKED